MMTRKNIIFALFACFAMLFAAVGCSQEVSDSTSTTTDDSSSGFKVTFATDSNSTVYVYSTKDYTEEPTEATYAYAVDSESGEVLTDGTGQVNFYVEAADGYIVDSVTVTNSDGEEGVGYKNVKLPWETFNDDTFRITKITEDLTVTVSTVAASTASSSAYKGTFTVGEHVSIELYYTDYSDTVAYSRDGDSGEVDVSEDGTGQINFNVIADDGYNASVSVTSGTYKAVKTPTDIADEDLPNLYRITKITSDLEISVTATAEQTYYTATFSTDDHCSVLVYDTEDYTATPAEATSATTKDASTGSESSTGEINFKVSLDDGYVVDSVVVSSTSGTLVLPYETLATEVYRITGLTEDTTVTVTTVAQADIASYAYVGTFSTGDNVTVETYFTEGEDGVIYSRSSSTGELLKDGTGQFNFYAVPADGYTATVTATEDTYNKCSDKGDNLWKITKVSADTTVTVSASLTE